MAILELAEEHDRRLDLKRARLKDMSASVATVFGAFSICTAFLLIIGFKCYAQIHRIPFEIDVALTGVLLVIIGALVGVSAKDIIHSLAKDK
jgi:hypothetical protein